MTKSACFSLWGVLFVFCAILGFLPSPTGLVRGVLVCLAAVFFLPPALLLYRAHREKDRATLTLIRNLSGASLGLTLGLLLANFFSLMAPVALGNVLYAALVILSTPMVCGQYWFLGLFGWACLLMSSLSNLRKLK